MATDKPPTPPSPTPRGKRKGQFGFRMRDSLVEALEDYAEAEGVTRNAALEHLLTWSLSVAGYKPKTTN